MRIRFIKRSYLDRLMNIDSVNLKNKYTQGKPWLSDYFGHTNWFGESKIEIESYPDFATKDTIEEDELERITPLYHRLKDKITDTAKVDIVNSIRLYEALKGKIDITQATDSRLWAYLSHETYWDFMIIRWPPEKQSILDRFFVNGSDSRALSRNGIARLWWFANLTVREKNPFPYELTAILLSNQNIQHGFLERRFGRSRKVLHTSLDFIRDNYEHFYEGSTKPKVDELSKIINRLGGVRLLDCQTSEEITSYLKSAYQMA